MTVFSALFFAYIGKAYIGLEPEEVFKANLKTREVSENTPEGGSDGIEKLFDP